MKNAKKRIISVFLVIAMIITVALTGCSEKNANTYEGVERSIVKEALTSYFTKTADLEKKGASEEVVLTITPDDYLKELFETEKINPTTIVIGAEVAKNSENVLMDIVFKNGEKEFLNANIFTDKDKVVGLIPQLTNKYIELNSEGLKAASDGEFNNLFKTEQPSREAIEEVVTAVLDEYFKLTEGVVTEEGVELTVDNTALTLNKSTIKITGDMVYKLISVALNTANTNEEFKKIFAEFEKEFEFDDFVKETLESFDYLNEEVDDGVNMTVYFKDGKAIKREFVPFSSDDDGDGEEFNLSITTFEKNDFYEVNFKEDNGVKFDLTSKDGVGSFTVDGIVEGRIKVDFTNSDNDFDADISYAGIDLGSVCITHKDTFTSTWVEPTADSDIIKIDNEEDIDKLTEELEKLHGEDEEEALESILEILSDDNGDYELIGTLVQSLSSLLYMFEF